MGVRFIKKMFSGHLSRKDFIFPVFLFVVLPYIYIFFIAVNYPFDSYFWIIFLPPVSILAMTVKRLRDIGWSRWLAIPLIIPFLNILLSLLLLFIPSKERMRTDQRNVKTPTWLKVRKILFLLCYFVIIFTIAHFIEIAHNVYTSFRTY